jgi:uncharacterized protein (DUF1684 family)
MKRFLAIALLLAACKPVETKQAEVKTETEVKAAASADSHPEEIQKWQANRLERLKREDGWLSLVALNWLKEGENPAPASSGKLVLKEGKVTLEPATAVTIEGKPVTAPVQLADDSAENGPTIVQLGTVRFQIIKRGERYGLRVKDSQAETRTHFQGLDYYPTDPKWRVEARLEPYNPPKNIPITDVTGMTSDNQSPGALVFTVDGKEYRIDPILEEGSTDYFIIFKDATSRDETYPAGRYLYAAPAGPDGKVIVDFNKAYNPPCAFTPFATCPLPPAQNRLPIRVDAGEKKYKGGHA